MTDNSLELAAKQANALLAELRERSELENSKKVKGPKKPIFTDINFKTEYIEQLEAQADELNITVQEFIELAVDFYNKHK